MKRRELTGAYFRFGLEFDVSYNILSHDSQQVKILRYIHVCVACEQARLCELGGIFFNSSNGSWAYIIFQRQLRNITHALSNLKRLP